MRSEVLWAVGATLLYLACAVGLRLAFGPALEADEGEMWLHHHRGYLAGYGPQLPLYYWLQFGLFDLFGKSLVALVALRAALLAATVMLFYVGLRLVTGPRLALLGALTLGLMPEFSFEAQRTLTHTVTVTAATAGTFAATLWVVTSRRWIAFVVLGVVVGLGALSKPNFAVVPLMLLAGVALTPEFRGALRDWRWALVPIVAGAMVAMPYAWIARNLSAALASRGKLQIAGEGGHISAALSGLVDVAESALSAVILVLLLAFVAWLVTRRRRVVPPKDARLATALLGRIWVSGLVIVVVLVLLSGTGSVKGRWLMVMTPFLGAWLALVVLSRARPRVQQVWGGLAVAMVAACLIGLAVLRETPNNRSAMDPHAFAAMVEAAYAPGDKIILSEHYWGGNLAYVRPDWDVRPFLAPGKIDRPLLVIAEGQVELTKARLQHWGVAGWSAGRWQRFESPFAQPAETGRAFYATLILPPGS